jgi:hypothetical protein
MADIGNSFKLTNLKIGKLDPETGEITDIQEIGDSLTINAFDPHGMDNLMVRFNAPSFTIRATLSPEQSMKLAQFFVYRKLRWLRVRRPKVDIGLN